VSIDLHFSFACKISLGLGGVSQREGRTSKADCRRPKDAERM
jgi:hypothetical protein